jgi:tetratricopeptide (TPR) repeat protein
VLAPITLLLTALLPQNPQVGVRINQLPSTIRLGEVVRATLAIESRQPPSTPVLPAVAGLVMKLGGPSTKQSMQIVNGRRSGSFSWNYPLEIRATGIGKFKLPPLVITIGGQTYTTRERLLEVVKEVTGANFGRVRIQPSSKRVYVHEPIRFEIECAIDSKLQVAQRMAQNGVQYYLVQLQADWLRDLPGAQRIEESGVDVGEAVNTVLNGTYLQPANVAVAKDEDGKPYRLFRYSKSFLPTRAGERDLVAAVLKFSVETGRRRGLFSSPEVREFLVYGKPIDVEVLPLPLDGRPDPYFGGVGRFTMAASLSKGRVKVGESLKLSVIISGRGNTEYLQVPELGEVPGFHQLGQNTNRKDGEVVVTYDLMPTTATVSQVPALQWNYFDTTQGVEKYVAITTPPLALEVQPITGVSSLAALPGVAKKAVERGVDDIFDVRLVDSGAAITLTRPTSGAVIWLASLAPWLVFFFGNLFLRARRRNLADVQGRRAKRAGKRLEKALADGGDPLDTFVGYLGDRLGCENAAIIEPDLDQRLILAGFGQEYSEQVRDVVDRGVAARYSGLSDGGVDRVQIESLVQLLERVSVRSKPSAGVLMKLLLLLSTGLVCSSSCLPAQEAGQELSKGAAAYRARDYDLAATEFAAAADAGDRIAAYNLGNTRYRQGQYAQALAAYERARLAMPRDFELLANIRLVREHLDLAGGDEAFAQTLASLRDSLTASERLWVCVLLNVLAAILVCFGGRRLRVLGALVTLLAVTAILEVAVLGPNRPPKGIVLALEAVMRAEPDNKLEARMKMRAGVTVEVLGAGSGWTKIRAEGLTGYVESGLVAVVE